MAKNELELEYKKELARINRFIKSAEKRGFSFGEYKPPKQPKTVTQKSLKTIRKVTPATLYKKATYFDPITQTTYTAAEGQHLIRSRAQKSAKRAAKARTKASTPGYRPPSDIDDILEHMEEMISGWSPSPSWTPSYTELKRKDVNIFRNILQGAINSLGREQVARNCQAKAVTVKLLAFHICYGSSDFKWDTIEADITALTAIVYGRTLTVSESKDIEEMIEQVQGYEEPE